MVQSVYIPSILTGSNILAFFGLGNVVVVLLFYVHGKHLWSCQLHMGCKSDQMFILLPVTDNCPS